MSIQSVTARRKPWKEIESRPEAAICNLSQRRQLLLSRYRMQDVAFKAVGVGSVDTFCFVALILTSDPESLIRQVKEARESVLLRFKRWGRVCLFDAVLSFPSRQSNRVFAMCLSGLTRPAV
ncbi:DUF2252 family protein [Bradyrhizobium sp. 173]|uniref:DUF2252 family protein n=1 Tax=Bradyrhizobium sp. 173 TaxID=2782644 RepID=UPI0021113201|nr:DUF2252 family protein [Bradyrhizobium sp. 173]MCK1566628.1 DUF2252 family protein [Bradyrhizobium sp. 173]